MARTARKPAPPSYVSYLRVSTARQGASGLGLEAQRDAVAQYIAAAGPTARHWGEFVEVESGKKDDRPELRAAIQRAEDYGAVLVIAKLDRLSRDAAFLLGLKKSGVAFVCCDTPDADRVTIGVLAVIAEREREMIGERTKAALAKKREVYEQERMRLKAMKKAPYRRLPDGRKVPLRLGNPNGAQCLAGLGNAEAVAAVKSKANAQAARMGRIIRSFDPDGTMSARAVAQTLNERGIPSPRDGSWTAGSVIRLRDRLKAAESPVEAR